MAIKYTLEDVEYLRGKAGISYEEAVALLEKYDGDMTRALVELEKRGKLASGRGRHGRSNREQGGGFARLMSLGMSTHVVVTRKDKLLADLPILYVLLVTVLAVWVPAITLVLMLFSGCRIKIRRGHTDYTERDLRDFMSKAADNIRESVSGFSVEDEPAKAPEEPAKRPFRADDAARPVDEASGDPAYSEPRAAYDPTPPVAPPEPIPQPTQVADDTADEDEGYHKITIE